MMSIEMRARLGHLAAIVGAIVCGIVVTPPEKVQVWIGARWPAQVLVAVAALLVFEFAAAVVIRGVIGGEVPDKFSWASIEWSGRVNQPPSSEGPLRRLERKLGNEVQAAVALLADLSEAIAAQDARVAALEAAAKVDPNDPETTLAQEGE